MKPSSIGTAALENEDEDDQRIETVGYGSQIFLNQILQQRKKFLKLINLNQECHVLTSRRREVIEVETEKYPRHHLRKVSSLLL